MSYTPRHSLKRAKTKSAVGIAAAATLGVAPLVALTALPATADPITDPTAQQNTCAADLVVGNVNTTGDAGSSAPHPIDKNVNVYAGGDFTSLAGSELEGRLVVNGDATVDGSGLGNLVAVGAGSGLTPEPGSTFVRIGGDFTLDKTVQTYTWESESSVAPAPGSIKVGGGVHDESDIAGTGDPANDNVIESSLGHDDALEGYSSWEDNDFTVLSDIADNDWDAGTDGTVDSSYGTLTLDGSSSATYHRFTIDSSDLTGGVTLNIGDNIAPTDPVVIKVTGDSTVDVKVQSVLDDGTLVVMGDKRFGQMASQILWVFPDQTDVTVSGGQFPGSVLVLDSDSTTTMAASGSNGRIWVAGDLVQDKGGSEFHAFPFIGDDELICSTDDPTDDPTNDPTSEPTDDPTSEPTENPTEDPGDNESEDPGNEDETGGDDESNDPGDNESDDVDGDDSSETPGDDTTETPGDDTADNDSTESGETTTNTDNGSVVIDGTDTGDESTTGDDSDKLADTGSSLAWLPLGATALVLMGGAGLLAANRRTRRS